MITSARAQRFFCGHCDSGLFSPKRANGEFVVDSSGSVDRVVGEGPERKDRSNGIGNEGIR